MSTGLIRMSTMDDTIVSGVAEFVHTGEHGRAK